MLKLIALLSSTLALLAFTVFGPTLLPQPTITADLPTHIQPGEEFTVTLRVQSHGITGFARLQQYLPAGFTAEAGQTKNADFIFDENTARFIWTDFPAEDDFMVSYKIKVDPSVRGKQLINGAFIYIDNEQTEKLTLQPLEITVGTEENAQSPLVKRSLIGLSAEKGIYRVTLTIQPNAQKKAAKFVDIIPTGYIAEEEQSANSKFTFENQQAVFSWTNLPSDSVFTVSYLVKSLGMVNAPFIEGNLVYGDEIDENKSSDTVAEVIKDELIANENENNSKLNNYASSADSMFMTPSGLYFRVQICATRKSPARDGNYFAKYKVNSPVEMTYQEGWRKYLIGNFTSYKEARALKMETRKNVSDAFIVVYENGLRITMEEAMKRSKINQ